MSALPAETLALGQVVQADPAVVETAPLQSARRWRASTGGATILRPEIADLIRAAYDPVMPDVADDASHALRLAARLRAAT